MPEFSGVRMNSHGSMFRHEKRKDHELCIKHTPSPKYKSMSAGQRTKMKAKKKSDNLLPYAIPHVGGNSG
jgi:hypothetical protein